tara:strand:- start:260 stop:1702 length:1443 start_codon:yes stop_codon:yes gene_type:complete
MSSNVIKYVHNDSIVEIKNADPNKTLLNYIRLDLKKFGTKEGCAEGGCGACTVVLGTLANNAITYQAVNSCIMFLPTINEKQLILVEDLKNKNSLHQVQKTMINFHGSQCGFCTPGFVMSLFSMYKSNFSYDEKLIKNSISGNLCRCTGYQPIINAAKQLNGINKSDIFSEKNNLTINLLKKIKSQNKQIILYNKNKRYFAPKKISELKKILQKFPDSHLLSGGTDLSLLVTKELEDINSIIYLSSIEELNFIKTKNNFIEIGATTPLIKFENYIKKYLPDFYKILQRYGSPQIRNFATIAGNIATASPIGDTLPILLSLNAEIIVSSYKETRIVSINNFFTNYRKTILKNYEFIEKIKIPLPKNNIFKAFKISKRFDDDISSVCAAFNIILENNIIKKINIAYGGMASVPKRAKYCEKFLTNKLLLEKNILIAQQFLEKDFNPINDVRASKEYRMNISKNLLFKFFLEINKSKLIRIYE